VQDCVCLPGDGTRVDNLGDGLKDCLEFLGRYRSAAVELNVCFDTDAFGRWVDLHGEPADCARFNESIDAPFDGTRGKANNVANVGVSRARIVSQLLNNSTVCCVHSVILRDVERQL
jgi:hypothetical protein